VAGSGGANLSPVESASLELSVGHTLGVVGESGSGKSTLALAALDLLRSTRRPAGVWRALGAGQGQ